jgi:hypothetical protein
MPEDNPLSVFNLINLYRNRVGSVLYLPDFIHFDPLGQQISIFRNLNNTLSTIYTLNKIGADKSGRISQNNANKKAFSDEGDFFGSGFRGGFRIFFGFYRVGFF